MSTLFRNRREMQTANQSLKHKKLFLLMLFDDKNGTVVFLLHLGEKCLRFNEILLSLPSAIWLLSSHSQIFMFALLAVVAHTCTHTQNQICRGGGLYMRIKEPAYKKTIYYCCHRTAWGTQPGALYSRLLKSRL